MGLFSLQKLFFKSVRSITRERWRPVSRPNVIEAEVGPYYAKVQHIIDGDTVIVSSPGYQNKIRLEGIDCPELGQAWGKVARYGLIKLIGGRPVRVEPKGIVDDYNRVIATLYVDTGVNIGWLDVNARMVILGHAWVLRRHEHHMTMARRSELIRMESWARNKKIGLWKDEVPIPPWEWRANNR